jgi:TonB family protein
VTLRSVICTEQLLWILSLFLAVPIAAQVEVRPPELVSATDTQYPIQSVADGIVVLDVALDKQGVIGDLHTVRDIPPLTSIATSSVQSWRFKPSSRNGVPQNSMIRVVFAFRPPAYYAAPPHFRAIPSGEGSTSREPPGFTLPGIVSVAYPLYPINAANVGSVVIQLAVGKTGEIQRVQVVRALNPFTTLSVDAVKKWQFEPSTLDGHTIRSNIVVVFVFAPLQSNK